MAEAGIGVIGQNTEDCHRAESVPQIGASS